MTHEMFVYSSYGVTGFIILGIVGWIVIDGRARRAELARLEQAGVKRRSEQKT